MVLAERNTGDVVRNGRRSRGPSPNTHTSGTGGGGAGNAHNAGSGIGGGGGGGVGGGTNSTNATANEKAATTAPGAGTPESSDDDNSTKRNGKSKAKQSEYEEKIRVGRDYQAVCPQLVPEPERRPELMNERALLVWSPTKEIPDLKLEEYISVAKEKYGYNGEQALGMLFWHKHDLERAVMDLANFTPFPDEWTIEDKVLFEQAFQFHGKSFHRIRQMLPDKSIASLVKYYYSWKKTRHRSSAMDRQEKMIKAAVKDGSENGSEVGSNEESDTDDKVQKSRQLMEQLGKSCSEGTLDEGGAKATANAEPAAAQPRISARWTAEENQVALLALRDNGKNFPMIAKVVGTKTEAHVRTFYVTNRRRLNLDQIVKEYEAMASSKAEESNAEEHSDAAAVAASPTTTTAATATATVTTAAAASAGNNTPAADGPAVVTKLSTNNDVSDASSPELLVKKDEATGAINTKKKPELIGTAAAVKSTESGNPAGTPLAALAAAAGTVAAAATSTATATATGTGTGTETVAGNKSIAISAPTITIVDESDTATSSSSDVTTSNNTAQTAGNSVSSLSGISSSSSSAAVAAVAAAPPAKSSSNNNHNDADSEAQPTLKSAPVAQKRDNSELNTAELPPAKKLALSASAEFLAK